MSATKALPLYGFTDEERANNVLSWFASSVVRRAMKLDPAVQSVLFAVGRLVRDGVERAEYAFVCSEEEAPGWPVVSSPKHNAMLNDGRSKALIDRCVRELYGCDAVELGHERGQAFYSAFARYARDPRPADSAFATAFAPVVLFSRRALEEGSWDARLSNFTLKPNTLASELSPECIPPASKPTSDDPRDWLDPPTLLEHIRQGSELQYSLNRATTLLGLLRAYRENPSPATLRALRAGLGIRDGAQPF